jgi:hypothetical protein
MPGQFGSFSLLNYRVCQLPLKSADACFASNAVTFYRFGPLLLIYETPLSPEREHSDRGRDVASRPPVQTATLGELDPLQESEAAVEVIMEQGQEVGLLAHRLFPGGVEVSYDAGLDEEIRTTRELVADPKVPAIFEGTFEPGGVLVRVDILHRAGTAAGMYSPKSPHRLEDSPPLQDPIGCELIGLQSFNLRGCRFIIIEEADRLSGGRER